MSDKFISSEMFILAAIDDKGLLGKILAELGANHQRIKSAIDHIRGGQNVDEQNAEDVRQALNKYILNDVKTIPNAKGMMKSVVLYKYCNAVLRIIPFLLDNLVLVKLRLQKG